MRAGERAGTILQRIRGFIRNEPLVTEAIHLGGLVTEVLAMMRSELLAHGVAATVRVATQRSRRRRGAIGSRCGES